MSSDLSSERAGTFFVLEEEPPHRRWYCHWDGADAPGFDSVDDAVAWGLRRARGVVVRTIGTVFYLVGDAPDGWAPGTTYWPWPPSAPERQQIDLDFEAACEAAAEDEAAWAAYEAARDAWLEDRRLLGQGSVVHECSIALPGSKEVIWFEEFDAAGELCGAASRDGRFVFGSAVEVLSSVIDRSPDDAWVRAVVAALERDRSWSDNRRSSLDVYVGSGEMFHVSAAANRESIGRHGLDWRLMQRPGMAGSSVPELEAIFLCESDSDVEFFTDMARVPSDVWAVDVTGHWIESGPSGWAIVSERIPATAVRVVRRDVLLKAAVSRRYSDQEFPYRCSDGIPATGGGGAISPAMMTRGRRSGGEAA